MKKKLMLERNLRSERWRKSRLKFVPGQEEQRRLKDFRSRDSRDMFSRHAASLVPTVDPGPGPRTTLELELTLQEGLELRGGSFSICEGVQAGVQCLEYSSVASYTPDVAAWVTWLLVCRSPSLLVESMPGNRSGEHSKSTSTKKMHRPLNVAQSQVSILAAETVQWFEGGGDPKEDERKVLVMFPDAISQCDSGEVIDAANRCPSLS